MALYGYCRYGMACNGAVPAPDGRLPVAPRSGELGQNHPKLLITGAAPQPSPGAGPSPQSRERATMAHRGSIVAVSRLSRPRLHGPKPALESGAVGQAFNSLRHRVRAGPSSSRPAEVHPPDLVGNTRRDAGQMRLPRPADPD